MPTTYPLATIGPTVGPSGISAPQYSDIYKSLQASFQSIYGSDSYIEPDSQDGQMLAIFAKAQADSNAAAIAVFNSFSPSVAQGVALSSQVKINGIARLVASRSTVVLRVTGNLGAVINGGVAKDAGGNRWLLPGTVVIPTAGFIDVTATAENQGAIAAAANTINIIQTPTLGWQTVNNAAVAVIGAPVESDAALRQRQTLSTALPSQTLLAGIVGAVASQLGVTAVTAYENDSNTTDSNGLPPHSIALVVTGGVAADIANAILVKKTPGAYTYGTTSVSIPDQFGITTVIRYFIPTPVPIKVQVNITALFGYAGSWGDALKQAVSDYINALGAGQSVRLGRLYLPAQLNGGPGSSTYEVTNIQISIAPAAVGSADIPITFNQIATNLLTDITLIVV